MCKKNTLETFINHRSWALFVLMCGNIRKTNKRHVVVFFNDTVGGRLAVIAIMEVK